jgi:hypothetical protein
VRWSAEIGRVVDLLCKSCWLAHREYARVGMRAPYQRRVQHPGRRNIGAKLPATLEQARILQPRKPGAKSELACHRNPQTAGLHTTRTR